MASAKQKRKKFIRSISGKVRIVKARKKTSVRKCQLCKAVLHGVPHGKTRAQIARLSKSEKKPTALFAGVLCSECRRRVIDNAVMVKQASKSLQNVDLSLQKFVKQTVEKVR